MNRIFGKLSKIVIASTVTWGAMVWSTSGGALALSKPTLDMGLQSEIREELGLPVKEKVTYDEVAILTSLHIDDGSHIESFQGLEEALFLHTIIVNGSHGEMDITALKEVEQLSVLGIDRSGLNSFGQKIVDELKSKGVNIVDLKADPDNSSQSPIVVYIDGQLIQFDIDPIVKNGSTLVPFRTLFEAFGLQVGWDQSTKKVTGTKDKFKIELVISSKTATVAGRTVSLATAPILESGTTMVPLRFIGEATGRNVSWDSESRTIRIDSTYATYYSNAVYSKFTEHKGETQDGVPHGSGTLNISGLQLYKGTFVNGAIEGRGTLYDPGHRKSYYEGEFKNNLFHGKGKLVTRDGSYFEGEFVNGLLEGSGKIVDADGSLVYIGDFNGHKLHGEGTIYYSEGTYYKGSFQHGTLNGQGEYYIDGKIDFSGEFIDNNRFFGKNYVDGALNFEGFFADNIPHGYGTVFSKNGQKYYRGQVKNNIITGIGIYYLADGSRYIGEVFNDTMDGFGFIVQPDGTTITDVGYWENDNYIGEEAPPVTDDYHVKLLLKHAGYNIVDGMLETEFDLDRNEAIIFIELPAKEDLALFNSLPSPAQSTFLNKFIEILGGDLFKEGLDTLFTYVMYDDKVYAEATISYGQEDKTVNISHYPKGNGTIKQ
ncbi:stalk domain-containing protein [Paenibacillus sp. PAMC21692]|uniref:stalk domain-containing protein n=1 Tax=Paenibacillus sp. PAMC21692 TaxID=2762320 RepID=UPI00164E92F3|nr:stalk domain-containing protein [Paenibacillus sp. PAMC21692]QNK55064.1 hypothetical protein H7F31_20825 [Paenibacillus sp. PAMC21692]